MSPPRPSITTDDQGLTSATSFPDGVILRLYSDRLVAGMVEDVAAIIRDLIPTRKRIVLDLQQLQFMDSTGLGSLVRLYGAAKAAGCSFELMHLTKQIRQLLVLTHVITIFPIVGEKGIELPS
ncbi:MAG: STAS domain-containing protein [Acidobacteria bacterium]|nr:STAS domain-containing protein [Acidobacteriota bacterium]